MFQKQGSNAAVTELQASGGRRDATQVFGAFSPQTLTACILCTNSKLKLQKYSQHQIRNSGPETRTILQ